MRALRHQVEYFIFLVASAVVGILPLRAAQRLGARLGGEAFRIFGFRRDIVLGNLRHAFPHEDDRALKRIAFTSFRSVGTSLIELLWFPRLAENRLKELVGIPNPSLFSQSLAKGKGLIVLTAHFGNWELVPQAIKAHTGIPLEMVYKPQSNRYIDAKVAEWRTRLGNTLIPTGPMVREMLRALAGGRAILIAADQSAPKESIRLDFFGRTVPVFQGPAVFSLKTGAPILLACTIRQQDGTYRLEGSLIASEDLQYSDEGVAELTRRHVRATEDLIRRFPDQWMWMHRRWKHADEEETVSVPV